MMLSKNSLFTNYTSQEMLSLFFCLLHVLPLCMTWTLNSITDSCSSAIRKIHGSSSGLQSISASDCFDNEFKRFLLMISNYIREFMLQHLEFPFFSLPEQFYVQFIHVDFLLLEYSTVFFCFVLKNVFQFVFITSHEKTMINSIPTVSLSLRPKCFQFL